MLSVPVARARHTARPQAAVKRAGIVPAKVHTVEGQVVEVRRMSRDVTIRTRQGMLQEVVIPRGAVIMAPHGERGLSGIRGGMTVRIVDGAGAPRVVVPEVVVQAATGYGSRGSPVSSRVVR